MSQLKIRDVDEDVVAMLDNIVKSEGYSSRNELLKEIITLYVTSHSEFFNKALCPTTAFLVKENIATHQREVQAALDMTYTINLSLLEKMDKLYALFYEEISEYSDIK